MELSPTQKKQIQIFKKELILKNQKMNLISRKKESENLEFLLEQSLLTAGLLSEVLKPGPVLDIGPGAGFPGLVFAILFPGLPFVLCERIRKKAEFLKSVSSLAGLSNVKVLCERAEDVKESYPLILSQAAITLENIPSLIEKLLSPGGRVFLFQNPEWEGDWPKETKFKAQVFKNYKVQNVKKVLLQLEWA